MSNPIADLTYRNYDGPMLPPMNRWWAIAKMTMKLALKKRAWFWVAAAAVALPYFFQIIVFYIVDQFQTPAALGDKNPFLQQIVWKDRFLDGLSYGQLFYMILAIMVGVGTIANDNRANALLIYLSRPCKKIDYIVGKWLGIFLIITAVTVVPVLIFYGYCLMGYRDYGFLTEDPLLFFKVLAMCLVPGVVHASLCVGFSSLFNQGRLAGAAYAGAYFLPLFITKAMQIIIEEEKHDVPTLVYRLFYTSIDGVQIGLSKLILGTEGSPLFTGGPRRGGLLPTPPPIPPLSYILPLALIPCALAILIAWRRVRAVEVVG